MKKLILKKTSNFEWTLDGIWIQRIISAPIWATNFFWVSALRDVRHCPKLQSCALSRKTDDVTLRKWARFWPIWRKFGPSVFFTGFTSTNNETLFEAIILCNLKENWWTKLEKKAKNLILDPILVCLTQIYTPSPQKKLFSRVLSLLANRHCSKLSSCKI